MRPVPSALSLAEVVAAGQDGVLFLDRMLPEGTSWVKYVSFKANEFEIIEKGLFMNGWLSRVGLFLEKAFFPVSRFLLLIGQFVLVAMVLRTVVDVFLRYVFNKPILGSYELTEFMMAILVFSSIGYTMSVKRHVVVDLVIATLPQSSYLPSVDPHRLELETGSQNP